MIRSLAAVSVGWLGLSMVADGVPSLVVPHQLRGAGDGVTELGIVTMIAISIAALAQPLAGAWSDRVGRAPVIAVGVIISVAGLALLVVPSALLPATVLTLLGVSVAQAGYQSLLPDQVVPRWRGRGAGAKGMFDLVGAFLAFAVLGGLLATGQVGLVAVLLAAGLGASLFAAFLLLGGRPAQHEPRLPFDPSKDDRQLPRGTLLQLIAARFLFLLGIYTVGRFLLFFIGDRLGLEDDAAAGEAAIILAALALITAIAAVPSGWIADRLGRAPVMLAGGLLAAVGIGALPLAMSTEVMLGLGGLMAVGSASFGAGSWAMLADLAEGADSGRLMGLANLGTAGAAAAAGLFGPFIDAGNGVSPGQGYAVAFGIAAAVAAAGGVLAWRAAAARPPSFRAALEVSD